MLYKSTGEAVVSSADHVSIALAEHWFDLAYVGCLIFLLGIMVGSAIQKKWGSKS